MVGRVVPAPGEGELPAANAAELFRRNGTHPELGDLPAVKFGRRVWSHRQFYEESCRWARLLMSNRPTGAFHVGLLLDNVPDYLFALGGAGLVGATVVGINHTRKGENLARDIVHTDVGLLVTEPRHQHELVPLLPDLDLPADRVFVTRRWVDEADPPSELGRDLEEEMAGFSPDDPGLDPDVDSVWALIFTSGTSSAPKAVICSQARLLKTGARMGLLLDVGSDDVGYVCMPLFHSNALMVGWMPAVVNGASVGLARRFSASGFLPDIRRYGATYFNYTGKPLAYVLSTPEQPEDGDNPLRRAYGNEGAPEVVSEFARRFDVEVVDAFGSTEGGIAVVRSEDMPKGSVGRAPEHIKVVDPDGDELPRARFDPQGVLANADECVGEIVNTQGMGPFEGYYNNPEATEKATRNGWYWSGDLGYIDHAGWLFFAGRTADWIRVDGENFPAGPIESALSGHPSVVVAAVYAVPDPQAGDQVMAALVPVEHGSIDLDELAEYLDGLAGIGPKWRPRYLRLAAELPSTGTNKVIKRSLARQKYRHDLVGDDELYFRPRGESRYRCFTEEDERHLHAEFVASGRERFWEL
ncbi:MAG: Long-chain-fatty-acid--CoA ligase FadD17 [Acidimicrobiales bacterium]|nr:Long-chain-fatty-acid--CoA ligase FadD17 [Acidimicrobiales bacterium]